MKVLGPFYLGLQEIWPIVASQFFSSTSLGLPIFLAQNQEWSLFIPFTLVPKKLSHYSCQSFLLVPFPWPLDQSWECSYFIPFTWASNIFGPLMAFKFCVFFDFVFIISFIVSWFCLWIFHGYFMICYGYFKDVSWNFMDGSWIFHQNFDQQVLVWCTFAANLHPWCATLMLIWCQFDASLMPVWCYFDAGLMPVWC